MLLPQTAEYALRAMAHLAMVERKIPYPATSLSKETGIPVHYLSKILRRMVSAKLLEARKGPGGGFVLARPLGKIRFIDILNAVDYEPDPDSCAFGWGDCDTSNACPLHASWSKLKEEFHRWARKNTLLGLNPAQKNRKKGSKAPPPG